MPCGERSAHTISKQGYHHGSVLITCPACRNRHVISDHLRIFSSDPGAPKTIEELLARRAAEAGGDPRRLVKKGTLGEDGDVEFWEDGTETAREERRRAEGVREVATAAASQAERDALPGSTFRSGGAGEAGITAVTDGQDVAKPVAGEESAAVRSGTDGAAGPALPKSLSKRPSRRPTTPREGGPTGWS